MFGHMTPVTVLLIAVGLAMDAFAVSVTYGISFRHRDHLGAAKLSGAFGAFQAGMPVVGWICGTALLGVVQAVDHWVAFGLLGLVGGKMIGGALARQPDERYQEGLRTDAQTVLALALATSIDALAVGLSLSLLGARLLGPVLVIGLVTLVTSYAGVVLGYEFKHLLGQRSRRGVQVMGGLILVGLGIKIVFEHLGLWPG